MTGTSMFMPDGHVLRLSAACRQQRTAVGSYKMLIAKVKALATIAHGSWGSTPYTYDRTKTARAERRDN